MGFGLQGTIQAAIERLRRELADRPFAAAASILTLALFVYSLVPFDFVMTTDALHASFGRARWGFMSNLSQMVGMTTLSPIAWQLISAGWFSVLGYLFAMAGRERGRNPVFSLASALLDGLILVVLVEFMQPFIRSHTFDASLLMLRSLGLILGAWYAVFMMMDTTSRAPQPTDRS